MQEEAIMEAMCGSVVAEASCDKPIAVNAKAKECLELLSADPTQSRQELAAKLMVTRQTIHYWIRKARNNEPIRYRGRPRKFGTRPSVPLTVRVPYELLQAYAGNMPSATPEVIRAQVRAALESAAKALATQSPANAWTATSN